MPTLFDKWHGIFYTPMQSQVETRLDIPRPLITQVGGGGGDARI